MGDASEWLLCFSCPLTEVSSGITTLFISNHSPCGLERANSTHFPLIVLSTQFTFNWPKRKLLATSWAVGYVGKVKTNPVGFILTMERKDPIYTLAYCEVGASGETTYLWGDIARKTQPMFTKAKMKTKNKKQSQGVDLFVVTMTHGVKCFRAGRTLDPPITSPKWIKVVWVWRRGSKLTS